MATEFEAASRRALAFLHHRFGFDLWMVTRVDGDDWVVLHTEGPGYDVAEGSVLRWADSFCWRMVRDLGPRVAPDSRQVAAYAEASIARQLPISAYVGVPLTDDRGGVFGTLCAIHPEAMPPAIADQQDVVETIGDLLSAVLRTELALEAQTRRAERAEAEALTDDLTGLYNRRGWSRLLEAEEKRCRRYGHPASVIAIDLDDLKAVNDERGHPAGDALIVAAADVLRASTRAQDVVARTGGDEFLVLGVETAHEAAAMLVERLRAAFRLAGIAASLGWSMYDHRHGLLDAVAAADAAMYAEKRAD
jgi:diguanylate cyclase (GGDEF)-like protein